jgi:hypothetical protein
MTRKLVLLISIGAMALGAGVPGAVARSSALPKTRANVVSSHSANAGAKKAITRTGRVLPTAVVPSHTTLAK